MRQHELKCWPRFFQATWSGAKPFDVRFNDRDYRIGDTLLLQEWMPASGTYTGRHLSAEVTFILSAAQAQGLCPLDPGFCILGLRLLARGGIDVPLQPDAEDPRDASIRRAAHALDIMARWPTSERTCSHIRKLRDELLAPLPERIPPGNYHTHKLDDALAHEIAVQIRGGGRHIIGD